MGRTVVRQLEVPSARRRRSGLATAGIGVVVLLALFGLISGGIFIAGAFSAGSHPSKTHHTTTGSSLAVADLARAQAQATAIVKAANDSRSSIVRTAKKQAQRQAAAIVAAAQKRARQIAAQPTPVPAAVAPVTTSQPTYYYYPTATPMSGAGLTYPSSGSASSPNLSGLPASWLVVGYNATFGSGPGSAGSISVINRSSKVFSGTAVVHYTRGGSSSAPFSGLAPGQSLRLPLNGPAYAGGGYTILVNVH